MSRLKTFRRGGVHPHDHKFLSANSPIVSAPLPAECVVPLQQHLGAPAECVVEKGQSIAEGERIGEAKGLFSAHVHAPVSGSVKAISEIYLPMGIKSRTVVIERADESAPAAATAIEGDWRELEPQQLVQRVQEAGIVGLGGATFPTHIKYTVKGGASVDTFVANGVECEPFLTADHRMMLEHSREIVEGVEIVASILQPTNVVIGIENNKPDAVEAMRKAVAEAGLDYRVEPLRVRYPQGDEKQLLKAVTGREVPSGGLPLDIGCVVSNVGSLYAIREAVVLGRPLVERVVSVTGSVVARPGNLRARIGTTLGALVEQCGGFTEPPAKLISGGPMMGFAVHDLEIPVTKGTSGIVALSRGEVDSGSQSACISCGACITACPLGLNPTVMYKWIEHAEYDAAKTDGLMDCKECGCCSFVCPAHLPLVQGMKLGKAYLRKKRA